jgi:hypothetical protein
MNVVSTGGEELMTLLVAWEMLGRDDLDPHKILRDVTEEDLETVRGNIRGVPETKSFVSCELVELELMFRHGLLEGDWSLEREENEVRLNFVLTHHTHWDPSAERITA